jgi:hypothetical protein
MKLRSVPASHGWLWITEGFRLFRRNPPLWLVLLLALFIAAKILALVPLLSVVFVLLTPVFLAGLMHGCHDLASGRPLTLTHFIYGFYRNAAQLVTIGGVSLIGNLLVLVVIGSIGGDAFVTLMKASGAGGTVSPELVEQMRGAMAVVGRAFVVGTLLSIPLLMAVWFAPLLIYFEDIRPLASLKLSFQACLRNTMPMLVYGMVLMAGLFLTLPLGMALRQYDLSVWLLAPVFVPSIYASYRDIFIPDEEPGPEAPPA